MFELHEKIQELENKLVKRRVADLLYMSNQRLFYRYSKEKAELDLIEERLTIVMGEKAVIVEEQQREEARVSHMDLALMMVIDHGDLSGEESQD